MLSGDRRPHLTSSSVILSPETRCAARSAAEFAVILDLDHTLVYAHLNPDTESSDFTFDLEEGGHPFTVCVKKRPYLDGFLHALSTFSDVYIFTAGTSEYAQKVREHLDPAGSLIRGVFSRKDCVELAPGRYMKPYEKCGTDMRRTVIVDDNPAYFGSYARNGIAVAPFVGQFGDVELPFVLALIQDRYREAVL